MRILALAKLICVLLLTLTLTSPAHAQKINAEGAAHLKQMFQSILDKQTAIYSDSDGPTIKYDGDITVEEAENYYAITLPGTIIEMPDDPKTTIKVGLVSINAQPGDKEKQWKMSFVTPSPILGHDAAGNENLRITLGTQSASGVWHEDFENFIKLNASYDNISANVEKASDFMHIENIKILYDLNEDANARWSGPSQITATNMRITPPENKGRFSLAKAIMTTTIDQADLFSIKNYATLITEDQEETTPDMNKVIEALMGYANGFGTTIQIADLEMQEGSKDEIADILSLKIDEEPIKFKHISLGEAEFKMNADGLLKDKTSASLSLDYKNFKASPMDANKQTLTPSNFAFKIANKNIPLQQITTMVRNALTSKSSVSDDISTALIVTKIPAMLAMAGTTLQLENNISNDTFSINTNGTAMADMASIFGGTANVTSEIKNLDKMIAATKAIMQDANSEELKKNSKLLTALSTLKEVGKVSQDSEGNTLHSFTLIMDQTGTTTLNGQPAMPILFNLQGLF